MFTVVLLLGAAVFYFYLMIDYKEKMIALFQRYYTNDGEMHQKKNMTTSQIFFMFCGVLPNQPITEHEVYEMLDELGYMQERVIIYNEETLVEENKNLGIKEKIDLVEAGQVFKWVVFEKE